MVIYNKVEIILGDHMKEKTIIMTSLNNSNEKAVLNLEKNKENFIGNLRLYNFKQDLKGILTLGFLINKEVIKAALHESKKGFYSFEIEFDKEINDFACALILIHNGSASPILFGSTSKSNFANVPLELSKNFDLLDKTNLTIDEVEDRLNESNIDYCEEDKKEIDEEINKNLCDENKCLNCNYRNAFYNSTIEQAPSNENKKHPFYPNAFSVENSFYDEIKGQLSLLFDRYPEETFLNEVIPDSKWVKVDYEDNGQYFVVGIIYENQKVAYVCYGMPGEFTIEPPRELAGISQWLPLDPEKPNELGYWIMYQDAETGESVEIKIS